jgi:hypothetical protein
MAVTDLSAVISQIMPLVSTILVIMVVVMIIKELKGVFS